MLLSDRRRERAIGANLHFVAQPYVRNEHSEKLDGSDELVITPQSRVKLVALVLDHTVVAVSQSSERNGRPFDVLEEGLERFSVSCGNPARGI